MRHITKIKRKRVSERIDFDHFLQLWFNYHFLFFRSLIFRGLKLRAFTFFAKVKKGLKIIEDFDPSFLFLIAMLKITPSLILKPLRIGGAVYEVPFPITYWKKIIYSCRWVIKLLKDANRVISVNSIVDALSSSLLDEGLSMEKKFTVYDLAALNRHLIKNKIFRK